MKIGDWGFEIWDLRFEMAFHRAHGFIKPVDVPAQRS